MCNCFITLQTHLNKNDLKKAKARNTCRPMSSFIYVAFKDSDDGIRIKSRPELRLCNITTGHFNAETKVIISNIRELLFADDCALVADSPEALQRLCDCFSKASQRFGLTISIKKDRSTLPAC